MQDNLGIKQILVINLGGIGDLLLSAPALRALRNHYPYAYIEMLIVPRTAELAKGFVFIDSVSVLYKRSNLWDVLRSLATLIRLKRRHFDIAINLRTLVSKQSAQKIKLLLDIIKPRIKVGRDTDGRGYFFDIRIPETGVGEKFEMEYDIDTVEALGQKVHDRTIDLKIDEGDIRQVEAMLYNENILHNDAVVGIHIGGSPAHRWPIEDFSKVINILHKKTHCVFVITGNSKEKRLAIKLIKNASEAKIVNCTSSLNFKELAALIKRCNLFISNDTGPMHVAAILDIPLVAIFGPGYLRRFDPRNISSKAIVLHKGVDCSPCNKENCRSLKCLKEISPEEVAKAALSLLLKLEKGRFINA